MVHEELPYIGLVVFSEIMNTTGNVWHKVCWPAYKLEISPDLTLSLSPRSLQCKGGRLYFVCRWAHWERCCLISTRLNLASSGANLTWHQLPKYSYFPYILFNFLSNYLLHCCTTQFIIASIGGKLPGGDISTASRISLSGTINSLCRFGSISCFTVYS